jgi:succinate-semialdehyde dehydrogenase/glutarate-semialdehyde dehydrogenase
MNIANDLDDACMRARAAQGSLAASSLRERAALLRAVRKEMLARAEEIIATLADESRKVRVEAIGLEIVPSALALTYAAREGPRALADERVAAFLPLPRRATRRFRPRGVVGLITPFNYTLAIPMGTIAPALAAGNAIVWKPALTGVRAARLFANIVDDASARAGLARGLVFVVEGGVDAGQALLHAPIDHLTFVGSTAAGRQVAARCGERLLPCILELGGSAPAIVLDDADLDRTASAIVFGGLANAGQSCIAVERVFAGPRVFDALLDKTARIAQSVRPGVDVSPLAEAQRHKVEGLLDDARAAGAHFRNDAVIDATGTKARIVDDEVFGPAIPFVRVADMDEAVARTNEHPQQLCAYVFGKKATARALAARLRAPNVVIGDVMISYAMMELPFGGARAGGIGRVHGVDGLRALCDEQVLVERHLPIKKEPWWLPYNSRGADWVLRALEPALRILDRR